MKDNQFDAIIIGAGPAGSATAISLARRGYRVALVDKQVFPRDKLCGDFVNPINWPVLEELGVDSRVREQPHSIVRGFRLSTHLGAVAEAGFPTVNSQVVTGLGLKRRWLDQILLDRASVTGSKLFLGTKVSRLQRDSSGWGVDIDGNDERSTLYARVLVGADGRNSWVAERTGLAAAGQTGRALGFQFNLRSPRADNRVEIHIFPGGYAGMLGLGDGTVNLSLAIDKSRLGGDDPGTSLINFHLPQNPFLKALLAQAEVIDKPRAVSPVYFPPRRCYGDGLLLAGDAARVTEPVTGEGIYFAMQSGLLAAATLDRAFAVNNVSGEFLRSYDSACRSEFFRRQRINALIRWAIYQPRLINRLIQGLSAHGALFDALVATVCRPRPLSSQVRA